MNQQTWKDYNNQTEEQKAYYELATIYNSEIDDEIGIYAVICAAIRAKCKGVSSQYLVEIVDHLSTPEEDNIYLPFKKHAT